MRAPRGDAELTKAEIIKAARRLFAEHGIRSVSVRDVAEEAGVTHGLIHHYFGTKEQLTAEVIKAEVVWGPELLDANPIAASPDSLDVIRQVLRHFLVEGRSSILLIARAELTGYEPEKLRPEGIAGSLEVMAKRFAELQAETEPEGPRLDPALVSVFIGAAVCGLNTMHPWLMASAGLPPEDYERRLDEIMDVAVALIATAIGIPRPQK